MFNWLPKCVFAFIRKVYKIHELLSSVFYKKVLNAGGCFRIGRTPNIKGVQFISLGDNIYLGNSIWLEAVEKFGSDKFKPSIIVGDNVRINDYVHIGANQRIVIGDDSLIGSKVLITDHAHGNYSGAVQHCNPAIPPRLRPLSNGQEVIIGKRVWVGEQVSILAGVTIGDGAVIGAGSVVTANIPSNSIAVGAPAKVVKFYSEEEKKWLKVNSSASKVIKREVRLDLES